MTDLTGHATVESTRTYAETSSYPTEAYREADGLTISSLGLGTYLGDPTEAVDDQLHQAVLDVLEAGVNHLDTAVNYRYQRSERVIAEALESWIESGGDREQVVVATKGGFIPFDEEQPSDPSAYAMETFVEPGIASPDQIVNGHCMGPDYLEDQARTSRENLGLETLDLYYVHNPEMQLANQSRDEVHNRLQQAFERLEELVDRGWIQRYGVATWNAFRDGPGERQHLSLDAIVEDARRVAGDDHHFQAVQMPFSLAMHEAFSKATQRETEATPLEVAADHGLMAMASAPLLQGDLTGGLHEELQEYVSGYDTDAQRALEIARSAPGITAALVGMKSDDHRRENLAVMEEPPLTGAEFGQLFEPVDV